MKIFLTSTNRQDERGFMIAALLAILSLMVIYTAANIRTLNILNREINAVEKKQIQRLKHSETQSPEFEPKTRTSHSAVKLPRSGENPGRRA